jgi:hypothetical protein
LRLGLAAAPRPWPRSLGFFEPRPLYFISKISASYFISKVSALGGKVSVLGVLEPLVRAWLRAWLGLAGAKPLAFEPSEPGRNEHGQKLDSLYRGAGVMRSALTSFLNDADTLKLRF